MGFDLVTNPYLYPFIHSYIIPFFLINKQLFVLLFKNVNQGKCAAETGYMFIQRSRTNAQFIFFPIYQNKA